MAVFNLKKVQNGFIMTGENGAQSVFKNEGELSKHLGSKLAKGFSRLSEKTDEIEFTFDYKTIQK